MGAWNGKMKLLSVALTAGVALTLAGCGEKKTETVSDGKCDQKKCDQKCAEKHDTTAAKTAEPARTDNGGMKTVETTEPAKSAPEAQPPQQTNAQEAGEENTGTVQPTGATDSREDQRQKVLDALYAQIRLQMEQAIVERKQLLDNGTPPSDEKVRALEGKIMKARSLLQENGEEVEEVDPPIVQPG